MQQQVDLADAGRRQGFRSENTLQKCFMSIRRLAAHWSPFNENQHRAQGQPGLPQRSQRDKQPFFHALHLGKHLGKL